jgi:hypothetical protein
MQQKSELQIALEIALLALKQLERSKQGGVDLSKSGILRGPILGMIGEAGPEMTIPLIKNVCFKDCILKVNGNAIEFKVGDVLPNDVYVELAPATIRKYFKPLNN